MAYVKYMNRKPYCFVAFGKSIFVYETLSKDFDLNFTPALVRRQIFIIFPYLVWTDIFSFRIPGSRQAEG